MTLKKMLLLASMALAAVAFTAPATAQAQQAHGLFEKGADGKTHVPLGNTAPVTLTSTNLKTETGLGTLTCTKVTLHYHVEHNGNNGTHVALTPTPGVNNNATASGCALNGTTPVHINSTVGPRGTGTATINTWGHGVVPSIFTARITTFIPVTCTYSGGVTIQGVNNTDNVNVGPSVISGNCGEGTMSGNFTVETPGTPSVPIFSTFKQT